MAFSQLTADFDSSIVNQRDLSPFPVGSGFTPYVGGLVQLDASGKVVACSGSVTGTNCIGQVYQVSPDGTQVSVREGDVNLGVGTATGDGIPTQANVGSVVFLGSDWQITTASANGKAGRLMALDALTGQPVVRIGQSIGF